MKFIILFILSCITALYTGIWLSLPFSLAELMLISYVSNMVYVKHRIAGHLLNSLLSAIFIVQTGVLAFSGEYISPLMLDNVNMMNNLGDELPLYISGSIVGLVLILIPYRPYLKHTTTAIFIPALLLFASMSLITWNWTSKVYSPGAATTQLAIGKMVSLRERAKLLETDRKELLAYFHKDSVTLSDVKYPLKDGKKPNIIIIFAEGFSAAVMDAYNGKGNGLTPNLNRLHSESLTFDNYYNHTAATFRALRGQLYSSCQSQGGYDGENKGLGQLDESELKSTTDTDLISLTDILKAEGYYSVFVFSEPNDNNMRNYLKTFGMNEIISDMPDAGIHLSDKRGFELFAETIERLPEPFLACFYNIGTHHGFDSPHLKFGDGSNSYFNKFHNYDASLGLFMDRLEQEGKSDDTILIFTADHATYPASDYRKAFDTETSVFIDRIPLIINWKGVNPMVIDAKGRNSLDFTPTVIDLLGFGNYRNYFLGTSLFVDEGNPCSNVASMGMDFYRTDMDGVRSISRKDRIARMFRKYYMISLSI